MKAEQDTVTGAETLPRATDHAALLAVNAARLANWIARHHTLELDTEAALLVNEARKAIDTWKTTQ